MCGVGVVTSPCLKTPSSIREGRKGTGMNRNSDIRYTAAHSTPMASGLEGVPGVPVV